MRTGTGAIYRAAALIEIVYKINPYTLSDEEFVDKAQNAYWYEEYRAKLTEEALMKVMVTLFGKKE